MTNQAEIDLASIRFRLTERSDAANLVLFAGQVFSAEWTEAYVEWKYFENPAGKIFGQVAEEINQAGQSKPLGFYGNIPVQLLLGRKIVTGAQAVDAMIAPEARRLGLFAKLNRLTYTQMDAEGVVLDYALPNPISEAGFVNRLGWQHAGSIPRLIKILDVSNLPGSIRPGGLRGLFARLVVWSTRSFSAINSHETHRLVEETANIQVTSASHFDPGVNDLWQQISENFCVAVHRDETYLNWRYVLNPQYHYVILQAWRANSLAGAAVLSLKDLPVQLSVSLVEWLYPADDPATGLALLQAVESESRRRGAAIIQTWMLPHHHAYTLLLQRQGYLFVHHKYLPGFLRYTTPLIIRTLPGETIQPDPRIIENWYLSMGDHDYF